MLFTAWEWAENSLFIYFIWPFLPSCGKLGNLGSQTWLYFLARRDTDKVSVARFRLGRQSSVKPRDEVAMEKLLP